MNEMWTYGLTVASIVGAIANIYKKRWGFVLWMITNLTWAVVDWSVGLPAQSLLFFVYFILALWGWFHWREN